MIVRIRHTVDPKFGLEAILTGSWRISVVPIALHPYRLGTRVGSQLFLCAIGRRVARRPGLLSVLLVNIRVEPSWLAADDYAQLIDVLGVFLCVEGRPVQLAIVTPLVVLDVVPVRRRHQRLMLVVGKDSLRRHRKANGRALPKSQVPISL